MDVINKYLTESVLKTDNKSLKNIILSGKPGVYDVDGKKVKVDKAGNTTIFTFSADMIEFIYKLSQVSDNLKLDYNQIGLGNKKNVKFIIDMD